MPNGSVDQPELLQYVECQLLMSYMAAPIGYQFPVFRRCLQVSLPCKVQVCQYNGRQCICTRDLGCIESEAVQIAARAKTPRKRKGDAARAKTASSQSAFGCSLHIAQYQYIPALGLQQGDRLSLTLNTAPSFHNPKSVLVATLPAVEQPQLPPLHAVNPTEIYCARRTTLVLPVEGAPLVFSTECAHEVSLRLTAADGKTIELPAAADALQGGYVVDTSGLGSVDLGDNVQASLRGRWGFDAYDGPSSNLFLIDSVSKDPLFTHPVQVPDGFPGSALPVPNPADGPLYVKLRDDPSVINPTTLTAEQLPASPEDLARAAPRQPVLSTDNNAAMDAGANAPSASGAAPNTPALQPPPIQHTLLQPN